MERFRQRPATFLRIVHGHRIKRTSATKHYNDISIHYGSWYWNVIVKAFDQWIVVTEEVHSLDAMYVKGLRLNSVV